ncbi:MAG: MBL fold metallo-hydrolase [Euryarchaeota archaeon]|nr:MBL fold metallo-hydrolase [Euryarchaeota archaeon]
MLNVKPLAFDSFGVRSMATFVETDDIAVLIDPGVSLAPRRYNLPPHPIEEQRMNERWADVKEHAARSDVLIVTHYHYDHFDPEEPELYEGKIVYLKHPKEKINKSQTGRASHFLDKLDELPKSIDFADENEFKHGATIIKFSPPVYHGTNPKLGYVVEVSISCGGEKMLFTSDVEGPSVADQAEFIFQENPDLLILDGPMTYMLGFRYSRKSLALSIENINRIIKETSVKNILVEHHFMRDLKYRERIAAVYECAAENDVNVITAAEYLGRDIDMLEARRRELYK